ncbi:hypothetical protein KIN20_019488, partial [Parelaphostrongylus tenuis]
PKEIKNLPVAEADRLAGADPDYALRDLFNAIEKGDYPEWTFYIQVMTFEQAETWPMNPFDVTKVWPHGDFPLIPVGKLVLNRNPKNYFSEVEQSAFCPAHVVPGIEFSPDKCSKVVYFPIRILSSIDLVQITISYRSIVHTDLELTTLSEMDLPSSTIKVLNDEERERLVENIFRSMKDCSSHIQDRAIDNFRKVHPMFGSKLRYMVDTYAQKKIYGSLTVYEVSAAILPDKSDTKSSTPQERKIRTAAQPAHESEWSFGIHIQNIINNCNIVSHSFQINLNISLKVGY